MPWISRFLGNLDGKCRWASAGDSNAGHGVGAARQENWNQSNSQRMMSPMTRIPNKLAHPDWRFCLAAYSWMSCWVKRDFTAIWFCPTGGIHDRQTEHR